MTRRNPGNDGKLLRDQYGRLKDAVAGFYEGKEVQALNIAVTLRVLLHETGNSCSLLSRLNRNYWELDIRDKPLDRRAVFVVPVRLEITGDGTRRMVRPNFVSPAYQLVPLSRWWNDEYRSLGAVRLSKKTIVLNVANKDGGAHVDSIIPDSHAMLSEPPFFFGLDQGGRKLLMQPNLAYGVTAQAGCEMEDYLERHFPEFTSER